MDNYSCSYEEKTTQRIYQRIGVCALFLLLCASTAHSQEPGKVLREGQPPLIPTVAKLDFERVTFLLRTRSEYHDRLKAKALAQFANAGLYPSGSPKSSIQREAELVATLTLTLDPEPLDNVCPGKVLYRPRLEMEEYINPERNPDLRLLSVTWSFLKDGPSIRPSVSLEQLEADLHDSLYQFILSYNMGNPSKKKQRK